MSIEKHIIGIEESYNSYRLAEKALVRLKETIVDGKELIDDSFLLKFIGMHHNQVIQYFKDEIYEQSIIHSFKIIATTEALLRIDYAKRVHNRFKDKLSRELRTSAKLYENRIETLIDLWIKFHPLSKNYFSEFRRVLKERHWIAHGRYWVFKSGKLHDLFSIYILCKAIENIIIDSCCTDRGVK